MEKMSSAQVIALFAERADHYGAVRLSVRQVQWLSRVFRAEGETFPRRHSNGHLEGTHGMLLDGRSYDISVYPNGAGVLHIKSTAKLQQQLIEERKQQMERDISPKLEALLDAGDTEGAHALMADYRAALAAIDAASSEI